MGPLADRIQTYMDLLSVRQKLVASNIANADTPDYRTRDIDFHFEYLAASGPHPEPEVIEPQGLLVKNDGNDVSMDREARLLAENAMRFNLATTMLRGQIKTIRNAIQEGKG